MIGITTPPSPHKNPRWLPTLIAAPAATSTSLTNTKVWLMQICIEFPVTIDALAYMIGSPAAGNMIMGIYNAGSTDTPAGGTLLATTASTAVSGNFTAPSLPLTSAVTLTPGQYWIAWQQSTSTNSMVIGYSDAYPAGFVYSFANTYGSLPSTCPAVSADFIPPYVAARVSS